VRTALLWFAWISLLGSAGDGLMALIVAGFVASGAASPAITVKQHLAAHLPWLMFVREIGYAVLPARLVDWIFGLPALAYFPARVAISTGLGIWAMRAARRMGTRTTS
jgi:hypothetical protein